VAIEVSAQVSGPRAGHDRRLWWRRSTSSCFVPAKPDVQLAARQLRDSAIGGQRPAPTRADPRTSRAGPSSQGSSVRRTRLWRPARPSSQIQRRSSALTRSLTHVWPGAGRRRRPRITDRSRVENHTGHPCSEIGPRTNARRGEVWVWHRSLQTVQAGRSAAPTATRRWPLYAVAARSPHHSRALRHELTPVDR
jgi:hypothetical protein